MELKFDVVKGQKFEIGRVITLSECTCDKCTFLSCPKKNYAVKTKVHKYSTKDFLAEYGDLLKREYFPRELLEEYIGECFTFPKGIYWRLDYSATCVELVSLSRSGNEVLKATINVGSGYLWDYDLSERHYKFAQRIVRGLTEINRFRRGETQA